MPKAYIEKVGEEEFRKKPVGSGPWKFVRNVAGDRIEFQAVDLCSVINAALEQRRLSREPADSPDADEDAPAAATPDAAAEPGRAE